MPKKTKKTVRMAPWSRSPSVGPYKGTTWRRLDRQRIEVQAPINMTFELDGIPFDPLGQIMHVLWFPGGALRGWEGHVAPSIIVLQWSRWAPDEDGSDYPEVRMDWVGLAHSKISVSLERFSNGCRDCEIRPTGFSTVWDDDAAVAFVNRHRGAPDGRLIEQTMSVLRDKGRRLRLGD